MSKITPQQAFDAIKVLYPDVTYITRPKTSGSRVVPAWDAKAFGRDVHPEVEIDWGNLTQYPETVYRDATPQDVIAGATAEFSTHPDFRNSTPGVLTGWVNDHDYTWWYRTSKDGGRADACRYCRIPVPAPEPAPPDGWEIITEEHKKRWTSTGGGYAKIMTEGGRIYGECFWARLNSFEGWRASGIGWIDNPKYIRPSE